MTNSKTPHDGSIQSLLRLCLGMRAEMERQRLAIEDLSAAVHGVRPEDGDAPRLYTTEDLSAAWQVSVRTIENLVAENAISPTYIKRARRFSADAIAAYERKATGRRRRSARRRTQTKPSLAGHGAPDRGPLSSNHGDTDD